ANHDASLCRHRNLLYSHSCYRSIAGRNRFTKQGTLTLCRHSGMRPRSAIADLRRRPGIHTHDRGYGFRARDCVAPRNDGYLICSMDQQTESASMSNGLIDLISILDLEPIEVNMFRGNSPKTSWQRVFGGQVIGQAMVAACRTVEGRLPHSLHCYFILPGDPQIPIIYQ